MSPAVASATIAAAGALGQTARDYVLGAATEAAREYVTDLPRQMMTQYHSRNRAGKRARPARQSSTSVSMGSREVKYHDRHLFVGAHTELLQAGDFTLLNGVAQSVTATGRVGQVARILSLRIRFSIGSPTMPLNDCLYRIMIVFDKQPNGSIMSLADLVQVGTGSYVASQFGSGAYPNRSSSRRFRTIYDKLVASPSVSILTSGATTLPERHFDIKKTFKRPLMIEYSGIGNTISSIQTGSLYLIIASAENNATETLPGIKHLHTRITFTD